MNIAKVIISVLFKKNFLDLATIYDMLQLTHNENNSQNYKLI